MSKHYLVSLREQTIFVKQDYFGGGFYPEILRDEKVAKRNCFNFDVFS